MATRWVNRLVEQRAPQAPGVDGQVLHHVFDAIRAELAVPAEFPPEVLAEASEAVAAPAAAGARRDGARVLHGRPGGVQGPRPGDVPGAHGDRLPRPLRHRGRSLVGRRRRGDRPRDPAPGQTIYAPDRSTPLHPETLSEDAASLLPGEARPAFVWDLRLDADGQGRPPRSTGRWCAASSGWTTRACRPRSTAAPTTSGC